MKSFPSLKGLSNIHAYDDYAHERKATFHREGKKFLKELATELGLSGYDLRSNMSGIAVSGEVTLHAPTLYVQISGSYLQRGVVVMFRACDGLKDYCGKQNHFVALDGLQDPQRMAGFLQDCRSLI